jgi:hypothetical protein
MRPGKSHIAIALCACFGVVLLWVSLAAAGRNQYYVQAVTIKVDRTAKKLSGKVLADSADTHFCTSSNDWPVNIRMVQPGPDKKVVHTRTNFSAEWRFTVRSDALKGKRLYAEVPSFANPANGFCNGARSRAVTAP